MFVLYCVTVSFVQSQSQSQRVLSLIEYNHYMAGHDGRMGGFGFWSKLQLVL